MNRAHALKLPEMWQWWMAPLFGALALLVLLTHGSATASGSGPRPVGMVCTTSVAGSPTFTLTARTGRISTPDGNSVYMWSFAPGDGGFQFPGPNLCVTAGDTVTIVLKNTLPEDTSLVFPGQDAVQANGGPSEPVYDGSGALRSLAPTAPAGGGTVTYRFTASHPGTYLYESGTDQGKQIDMGLYGALVVRPAGHADHAYQPQPAADSKFNTQTEYLFLLSQLDPALHQAVERHRAFDMTTYTPRYFFINGRTFPDTIAPNGAPWLPNQPYGSLFEIQPHDSSNPDPALLRYVSTGPVPYPFHPHGNHGRVIARDGQLLMGPGGEDLSYEKFTMLVGPGQTVDATYTWTNSENWDPTSNPIPVTLPPLQNLLFKGGDTFYSGSPYLGHQASLPVGTTVHNECGEYYHMMHSHALHQITNYGVPGGGMLTLMRIDPPGGC